MPSAYACVSVRQPWADLLAAGIKPVENRAWRCAHRGTLLIHAGRTWGGNEQAAHDDLLERAIRAGRTRMINVLARSRLRLGCIVGMTEMTGCVDAREWRARCEPDEWFVGPFGWLQSAARQFDPAIPYKGRQGLFRVPATVVDGTVRRRENDAPFLG